MSESSENSVSAMEMVEEAQIQAKVSPKPIKFQKVIEKWEEDRISSLPDCLLLEILFRLPTTKDAITTGTLSKRWKHVWTFLPVLIFKCTPTPPEFFSFVDKTLSQCCQLKLKEFVLIVYYDSQFESQLSNWIRYAINCNVEELKLSLWSTEDGYKYLFDEILFISSCFTHLTFMGCRLNPTVAISWKNLTSLRISFVKLDEDLIENILSGSPVLEKLVLDDCYGYRQLDITSKSLKNLVLSRYPNVKHEESCDIIIINAPNISSLAIYDDFMLWKILLLNVSSLVEADLDYVFQDNDYKRMPKEVEEEMLKEFLLKLHHVKELKIGDFCSKVVSRLKAKGFVFPSNIVKFPDETWSDTDSDTDESEDS